MNTMARRPNKHSRTLVPKTARRSRPRRLIRSFVAFVVITAIGVSGLPAAANASQGNTTTTVTPALTSVTAADWNAGMIISDADFYDYRALTESDIQTFLNTKGARCVNGVMPCLRSYVTPTPATVAEQGLCNAMPATSASTAAQIIARVAAACRISPKTILAMIQKESAIVTTTNPTASMYRTTAGFGCPDFKACDTAYYGFFNQIYRMARQFQLYTLRPTSYGIQAGRDNAILYHPNTACGSSKVFVKNQATANLYIYTPFQPNAASLANLGGTGDSCSAYGNRNFWVLFNSWWTPTPPPPVTPAPSVGFSPRGDLTVSAAPTGDITATGWAIDESDITATVTVTLTINGKTITSKPANGPFAPLAFYGVPGDHGFTFSAKATSTGANEVCVIGTNIGSGADATIGCRSISVTLPKGDPIGTVTAAATSAGVMTASGWAAYPGSPSDVVTVKVTDNGALVATVSANSAAPTGSVSGNHGYAASWTVKDNGAHTVCGFVVNPSGGADTALGCAKADVVVPGSPQGAIRAVTQDSVGWVIVTGWSFDPSDYAAAVAVTVTMNGQIVASATASQPFTDLAYYGVPGNHGFLTGFLPNVGGAATICASAVNVGPGANQSLGCTTVTMSAPGSPIGAQVSAVRDATGRVVVSGWAWDQNVPYSPLTVMVTVDGVPVGFGLAGTRYPALAFYGIPGDHGYRQPVTVTSGTHSVCTFAFNQGPGENRLLGCTVV